MDSAIFALVDPIAYGQLTHADLAYDLILVVVGKYGRVRHIQQGVTLDRTWCLLYSTGRVSTQGDLRLPICSRCLSSPYAELARES